MTAHRDRPAQDESSGSRSGPRLWLARVAAVLAGVLVLVILNAPSDFDSVTLSAFIRIPLEGVLGLAVLLALPGRARSWAAVLGGTALGMLAVLKVLDGGFDAVLLRPFDLVFDWVLFGPAVHYVGVTSGHAGAIAIAVAAVGLAIALVILSALSILRLSTLADRHRRAATRGGALMSVVWLVSAVFGAPIAAHSTADLVYQHTRAVLASLNDKEVFSEEAAVDAFSDVDRADLLTGLHGKDVVIAFIESYGRVALDHPEMAGQVGEVLDAGTDRLRAAGFSARSAFLTSPTTGGSSWLAHSTFLSGLWIDNQQRYRTLVASERFTLTGAFARADWTTVGIMPGITRAWPEGGFYEFDRIRPAADLGYHGPRFGYATMPDQYALAALQRSERATPGHPPVMAVVALVASHSPWLPVPRLLDWDAVGDGSVFATMPSGTAPDGVIHSREPAEVRADYRRTIEYSVNTLVSYVETYGGDDLVLVFLGDHQPSKVVTGQTANRDVPITIAARDPAVLERIADWGWQDGLRPASDGPSWPMDTFRDRFLTAFGRN